VYAEPNYEVHMHLLPNDTRYSEQWAHPMINSPAAWEITTGNPEVIIAVLDTGVDLAHSEFQGRLVPGFNYISGGEPQDDQGHGTHVAGIAAATGNNAEGVAGMAWQVKIMPVKVLDASGSGSHAGIAAGMTWAVDHGARIINLSLGGTQATLTLQNAVQYVTGKGALIVASAGNCGDPLTYYRNNCTVQNQPVYPAAYGEVFAVAATTSWDGIASYSNQGSYVDIAAPGDAILSTRLNGGYTPGSGTSQAAPFVAGLAALLWSMDSNLSAHEIEEVIESTAVDKGLAGFDIAFGHGRIDAFSATTATQLQAPVLYAVDNPGGEGSYTVDWSDVSRATGYTVEEAANSAFSTPSTVYTPWSRNLALPCARSAAQYRQHQSLVQRREHVGRAECARPASYQQ
jgi:thermitase